MMVSEHLMQRLYQDIKHIADSQIPYDHKIDWICVTSLKPNTFHGNYSCFSDNQYLRMTGVNVIEVSLSFVSHKMPTTPLLSELPEIKLKTRSSRHSEKEKHLRWQVYSWKSFKRGRRLLSLSLTRRVTPSVNFALEISKSSPPPQVYAICDVKTGSYILVCKKRFSALNWTR